jgi:hypothetical protein
MPPALLGVYWRPPRQTGGESIFLPAVRDAHGQVIARSFADRKETSSGGGGDALADDTPVMGVPFAPSADRSVRRRSSADRARDHTVDRTDPKPVP